MALPTGKDGTDFNDDFVASLNAGLSRDDALAAIRESIESQITADSMPDFQKAAMGITTVSNNPVALLNDVPMQVHCVCDDKVSAELMREFVHYKRVFVEADKHGLTLKSVMKTCKISDGKNEVEAGIYWLAVGSNVEWLRAAENLGMACFNADTLQHDAINKGLKAVSTTVNKSLVLGVGRIASRPKFEDRSSRGRPLDTLENWQKLTEWEGCKLSYNEMTRKIEFRAQWAANVGSSDVVETNNLSQLISAGKRQELSEGMIADYALTLASENSYHPVRDWIARKPWDGVSRLPEFCDTLVTTEDKISNKLKTMLISRWLVGAVQAAISNKPNAQHGVLVLTGNQGLGKTRWIKALCPDDAIAGAVKDGLMLDAKNPDSVRLATEQWISELGELDGTFRKSDIANLKAFVTSDADVYRMPYARSSNRYPRRTAFIASVNETQYLVDDTGNRRFWTIPVESIDYEHTVDMQQLWAEIEHYWREGALWYLTGADLDALNEHNESYSAVDPYQEVIRRAFCFEQVGAFTKRMTSTDVALACGYSQVDKKTAMAFSRALRKVEGIFQTSVERFNGALGRFWLMPELK
jgi:putative DNA primase/helicase